MNLNEWERAAERVLRDLRQTNQHRDRRIVTPVDATHVEWQGRQLVNFASNDYLGLSHHPAVVQAIIKAAQQHGAGSGAAGLITGFGSIHERAEKAIARWKGTPAAVLLPSGYQANHAAVQTLAAGTERAGRGIRFLLDKLCHASLIDAVRGTGAAFRVFPHNHMPKLSRLLSESDPNEIQVVITESIFSMDGDAADLNGLAALKKEYGFLLVLDEAHASGVYGENGRGLPAESGHDGIADVTIVTFSKAAGCAGGAVCGSNVFCEALVNLARAYMFSTSVMPALAGAVEAAVGLMAHESGRRLRVRALALQVREALSKQGLKIPEGDSPIIPVILGTEAAALDAAAALLDKGILTLAIRPPTVAKGASRLRLTLSSQHTDEEISQFLAAMGELVHP